MICPKCNSDTGGRVEQGQCRGNSYLGVTCDSCGGWDLQENWDKKEDHKKLHGLAMTLADDVCQRINEQAPKLETPTMPYRQQYVLEELIKILEARV